MPTTIRDATNTARNITGIAVRDDVGTLRTISEVRARDTNGTLRLVWSSAPPLSVAASPDYVFGVTLGGGSVATGNTTATPTGGTAPYTYAWTVTAFDNSVTPSVTAPTSATTSFLQTNIGLGESFSATFQIEVTDSNALTAVDTVSASFTDAS